MENQRGALLSFQKVTEDVLMKVMAEILVEFRNTFLTVHGSPIRTSICEHPLGCELGLAVGAEEQIYRMAASKGVLIHPVSKIYTYN